MTQFADNYKALYISSGRKNCFYTLRMVTTFRRWTETGSFIDTLDMYECKLTRDRQTSITRAKAIASRVNVPLVDTNCLPHLDELRRRSSDQVERERQAEQERRDEQERKRQAEQADLEAEINAKIASGVMPYGKFAGVSITELWAENPGYVTWMYNNTEHENLQEMIRELIPSIEATPGYVGEEGEKVQLVNVHIIKSQFLEPFCYGAASSTRFVGRVENGQQVMFDTASAKFDDVDQGDVVSIKAVVKKHRSYDNADTTVLKRPSIIA